MAKFAWEGGERILLHELVTYARDGKNVPNGI